ncbi:MAG TPA: hypothetical protein ENK55_01125 [Actinobacteria bacterium]|nr:hypothetical protein [Actinomycetota bacterium]
MKLIVVGAGGTTRELMRRLGELWECTVVDVDPDALARVAAIGRIETMVGDGSSPLVLERAGLDAADALVAATDDDDVNLEACRIAKEANLIRVIGVVAEPERSDEYRAVGVVSVAPESLAARHIEVQLEPRRVVSTAFADGKAEAIEFSISPDSTVRGKRLRELHSETWIVAAVLRGDELIVPHGDTRLEAGDRVTVVGAASDFSTIVRTFTAGEARFPLGYGRKVAVVLDGPADLDGPVGEALSVVRNSPAEELLVVHRDLETERDAERVRTTEELLEELRLKADGVAIELAAERPPLLPALVRRAERESVGLLVVPGPRGGPLQRRLRGSRLLDAVARVGKPVLLSRATHPYASIVVPARRTPAGEAAGRAGIDLAKSFGATLVGVAVVPPAFVSDEGLDEARRAAAWLREEAAVHGVTVRRRIRRGNPVRILEEAAKEASLVVLALPERTVSVFRPGISALVAERVDVSVLLVPELR